MLSGARFKFRLNTALIQTCSNHSFSWTWHICSFIYSFHFPSTSSHLILILLLPGLNFPLRHLLPNLGLALLPKRLDGLVVHIGSGLTGTGEALRLALRIHVRLEFIVDARLVGRREAVLFLVVTVAEVMAVARILDWGISQGGSQ